MGFDAIHEPTVRRFSFYKNGQLCEGMIYKDQIYKLVETFTQQNESQAHALFKQLKQTGNLPLMTTSTNVYRVWTCFRSQCYRSAPLLTCR